jgi:hypothetical protein
VFLSVDKSTGAPTSDAAAGINEAFISGTQPGGDLPPPELPAVVPEPQPSAPQPR